MVDARKDAALGLGERLRSARKARALTLQQAAFNLHLEESVLRALEDERYDVLGAAVFVRGHLKAYARLLGLSEEAVLQAYRASDPSADAPPKVTRDREKPLTPSPGPTAILAAVGLSLLAMVLLYMLSSGEESASPVSPPEAREPAVVETVPVMEFAPVPVPAASPAPASASEPAPPAAAAGLPEESGPVQAPASAPALEAGAASSPSAAPVPPGAAPDAGPQ